MSWWDGDNPLRSVSTSKRGSKVPRGLYRRLPASRGAVRSPCIQRELNRSGYSSSRWSRHSARDVPAMKCGECERLRTELEELRRKYKDLEDRYHGLLQTKQREAASPIKSLVRPKSRAMKHERSGQTGRYRVGISYETSQQRDKYSRMAGKVVRELKLSLFVQQGARPDDVCDIVLHFARTEGGRTVNLDPEIRRAFTCSMHLTIHLTLCACLHPLLFPTEHVILVLLRSGKNETVFSKFVPVSKLEYSGINLESSTEKKCIVQFLHWQGEWVASKLNNDNLQLLKELMREACPGIVPS